MVQSGGITRLMVCADDYGFTPGVSRGIRELIAARRISATSVMAASEFWPTEAPALKSVVAALGPDAVDIGLHVTLTDQVPLGPMPTFAPSGRFPRMMDVFRSGLLRRLPRDEISAEIDRQLASFIAHFGQPPAHIDGHHHIQQLPGIRELVIAAAARVGAGRTWVRSGREPFGHARARGVALGKALLIGSLGRAVTRHARRHAVPVNAGFSGAYDYLSDHRSTADLFARFVHYSCDRALVMCHPGYSDDVLAARDVMTSARDAELKFLMSDAWPALVTRHGARISAYHGPQS
jgi:chitin disaccharide deacetylase